MDAVKFPSSQMTVFNGTNWDAFESCMRGMFRFLGAWDIVKGKLVTTQTSAGTSVSSAGSSITTSTGATYKRRERPADKKDVGANASDDDLIKAQAAWDALDQRALGQIEIYLDQPLRYLIRSADHAWEAWQILEKRYKTSDAVAGFVVFKKLMNLRMQDGQDIHQQVTEFLNLRNQVSEAGIELPESMATCMLLAILPPSYATLASVLLQTKSITNLNVVDILSKLREEQDLREVQNGNSGTGSAPQRAARTSTTKPFKKYCDKCKRQGGHSTEQHRDDFAEQKRKEREQKKPQQGGDSNKNSDKRNKGKQRDKGQSGQSSRSVTAPASSNAISVSLYTSNDPKNPDYNIQVADEFDDEVKIKDKFNNNGTHAVIEEIEDENDQAVIQQARNTEAHLWLIDSGASSHLTPFKSDFTDYKEDPEITYAALADGSKVPIIGRGTVLIHTTLPDNTKSELSISHVLYIPKCTQRIISPQRITALKRFYWIIDESTLTLHSKGDQKLLCSADLSKRDNSYWIHGNSKTDKFEIQIKPVSTWETWHKRFGHAGRDIMDHLPKAVTGMPEKLNGYDSQTPCEGCQLGKHHRDPFHKSPARKGKVLALVHADLDEVPHLSIDGFKWTCTFLDDSSSKGVMYALKHKDEALAALKSYQNWVKTKFGRGIEIFRSDRGGEFMGHVFDAYLAEEGIERQTSAPRSPQQNGRAERFQQTIFNKAEAMRHAAGLSSGFWKLAIEAAIHVYNLQPSSVQKWRSPEEKWDGTTPDVSHLRIFGCLAYVQVHKKLRVKTDPKSKACIFVGYEPGSKAWRFWDPEGHKVIISRDAKFDETVFPRKQPTIPTVPGAPLEIPDAPKSTPDKPESQEAEQSAPAPEPPRQQKPIPPAPQPAPRPKRNTRPPARWTNNNAYEGETPAEADQSLDDEDDFKRLMNGLRDQMQWSEDTYSRILSFQAMPDQVRSLTGAPLTYKEAMKRPDADDWTTAMEKEYNVLMDRKVWTLVDLPKDRRAIKCRWVYAVKHDGRFKARLVAKGFTQEYGIDYEETFSPVSRFESIRAVLALAAMEDWEIEAMDVTGAYLYGELDEEIYMEQPPGFVKEGQEHKVCKLQRAIYGLKQSGKQWNKEIHASLIKLGFKRTRTDAGIYVYRRQEGYTEIILIIYVDDLLLCGPNKQLIKGIKADLQLIYQMTDMGPAQNFLGLQFIRNRELRYLDICQSDYWIAALARFGMTNCKTARTPLPAGCKLEKSTTQATPEFTTEFQSLIGTLIYGGIASRPDIHFAVIRLAQYSSNPSEAHMKFAKHILRYIAGTIHRRLRYQGASSSGMISYDDSDWAANVEDRHSLTGHVILFAEGAIAWATRRQKTVALSSTEAEYMALSDGCRLVAYFRNLFEELGEDMSNPTPICVDNQGAIFLAVNPAHDKRTKHIDIRYHYVREFIEQGHGEIYYIPTNDQVADVMTKPLSFDKHATFSGSLGLTDS